MGWRVPDAVVPLFRMVKQHPQLWFVGGTCAMCSFLQWRANVANRSVLLSSQKRIVAQHTGAVEDCKEQLRVLDMEWNKDMRRRDDMMRKMVVQNVEQARSVDRLDAALKLCINTPPSSIQVTSVVTQPKEPALVAESITSSSLAHQTAPLVDGTVIPVVQAPEQTSQAPTDA